MNMFKNKILLVSLIILAFFPILALFHPGLPITHDGQDHVARIANFYQNLSEGVLIPRWAGNLNWGYGHPILEFLYPLPSYIASFFHFAGFSFVDSVKVVFGLGMFFSVFFMYLWLSQFLSRYAAILGALLFTYAPYRFVETYVRGDIGENLAFAFIPLVLLFVYKNYKKNDYRNTLLGGISLALLILAHNAISLIFVPLIVSYGLLLLFFAKNRKKYFINFISIIFIGFSISCFFWLPALLEGKYTLRNIVTKGTYISSFISIQKLIYGPWNYGISGQFTVQLGILQWIAFIASPIACLLTYKKNKESFFIIAGLAVSTIAAIFLMLPISNLIWTRIMLLQNFQFPWRFLALIVFSSAVLGAYLFSLLPKKYQKVGLIICIAFVVFIEKDYMLPKGYQNKPESFYSGIYNSTTDTGESSPIWSVRFMEKRPKANLIAVEGDAKIINLQRTVTYHKFSVDVSKSSLFEENTLYFPGWEIRANKTPLNIEFQNRNYRGLMTFILGKGNYIVEARYSETKLRLVSDFISVITIIFISIFAAFRFVKRKLY